MTYLFPENLERSFPPNPRYQEALFRSFLVRAFFFFPPFPIGKTRFSGTFDPVLRPRSLFLCVLQAQLPPFFPAVGRQDFFFSDVAPQWRPCSASGFPRDFFIGGELDGSRLPQLPLLLPFLPSPTSLCPFFLTPPPVPIFCL